MLIELRVRQLGVIEDLTVLLGPGMTALTGETGAGKTLLVEAIELLLGGRSDTMLVRPGATEATVEGRFGIDGEDDVVLSRSVPASGRGRAYVDGRMASLAALGEAGRALVDLHGQHANQSLFSPVAQREALDHVGGIDTGEVAAAKRRVRAAEDALAAIGGDGRSRARELDLLRFQLDELEAAGLDDPDEDEHLRDEEARLSDVSALREAASAAYELVAGDDGAIDRLGAAVGALDRPGSAALLGDLARRVRGLEAEAADIAADARRLADSLEDDPERLAEVSARRARLSELRRKYGETLAEVIAFRDEARFRAEELASHGERTAALERERAAARQELEASERRLAAARHKAAAPFAASVEKRLRQLALPRARFAVEVDGETVTWMFAANPGQPLLPLRRVASGGELARTMLAARLVATDGLPRTLIFDEVDAGVGGEAAVAVGEALAALGRHHQVLVVTHLPQVAACADAQIVVSKAQTRGRTTTQVRAVEGPDRVVELSRMLSGQPESTTARRHAAELLARASAPGRDSPR